MRMKYNNNTKKQKKKSVSNRCWTLSTFDIDKKNTRRRRRRSGHNLVCVFIFLFYTNHHWPIRM